MIPSPMWTSRCRIGTLFCVSDCGPWRGRVSGIKFLFSSLIVGNLDWNSWSKESNFALLKLTLDGEGSSI